MHYIKIRRATIALVAAAALVLAFAACGGGSDTSSATVTVGGITNTIDIRGFKYAPGNLQVPVGARITWKNFDGAPHTATAKDKSWNTGDISKGEEKTLTFDKVGDYLYYCTIHPTMKARIQVR
ncbi:MAG TPA: cupredoxin family copper-binding protein [Dehalococcoidia bacterium]